jgi:hypothetical protein
MKFVFQLYRLWLCLNCSDEIVEGYVYQTNEALVVPIVPIGIVNADLNSTFGVNGAATVSLNLNSVKKRLGLTCDKGDRPRDIPSQNRYSSALRRDYEGAHYPQGLLRIWSELVQWSVTGV